MVHLLPHERYELYMDAVDKLDNMAKCLSDHNKCVCGFIKTLKLFLIVLIKNFFYLCMMRTKIYSMHVCVEFVL